MSTSKTIASISAAAAVAVGTAVYVATDADTDIVEDTTPPEFVLPALELPSLGLPSLEIAEVTFPTITDAASGSVELDIQELDITELEVVAITDKFGKDVDIAEVASGKLRDQRNLEYSLGGEYIEDWMDIYKEYEDVTVEYVPADPDMRMVAEVSLPTTQTELSRINTQLARYKKQGFNTVLVSYDTTEDITQLKQFVQHLKTYCGFDVYFTFGGSESLKETIFVDPVKYKELLTTVGKECKGFLLGWRRTSLHLLLPDTEWTNFHMAVLRATNPSIIIFGEVYYGMTAYNHPEVYIEYNIPKNVSGVIVFNFGSDKVNQEFLLKNYLPRKIPALKGVDMVGVVIKGNKEKITERFIKGGSKGIIDCIDSVVKPKSINKKRRNLKQ